MNEYYTLGNYRIYNTGKIYSELSNRFLQPDITKDGYEQVTLALNKQPVRFRVHRLVAKFFCKNDNPEVNIQVNHIDGDKRNNHFSNLEWCTAEYNNRHARETGLNNVSLSNSRRWNNDAFRESTSRNISKTLINNKVFLGSKNPKFRYRVFLNGKEMSRQQLIKYFENIVSVSTLDKYIRLSGIGIKTPFSKNYNITVIDTKNK